MLSAEIAPILVTDRAMERLCNASRILFNALNKKYVYFIECMRMKIFKMVAPAPVFWIRVSTDIGSSTESSSNKIDKKILFFLQTVLVANFSKMLLYCTYIGRYVSGPTRYPNLDSFLNLG